MCAKIELQRLVTATLRIVENVKNSGKLQTTLTIDDQLNFEIQQIE